MREWLLGLASGFWRWLREASQGQATFLGWVVGFVTLVLGALLNAHLNRKRDDRLRQIDQRALATALKAELAGLRRILLSNSEDLQKKPPESDDLILIQDLTQSVRIMPEIVGMLHIRRNTSTEQADVWACYGSPPGHRNRPTRAPLASKDR